MAKTKSPTPQELYKQRKQKEEEERDALLPPGLWNHGNTCFMNSVLQGLIATRFLSELAHFEPLSPQYTDASRGSQIVPRSRRSPLLTNGYGQAGQYERDWVDMMPIGDVFIQLMLRAWKSQDSRKRESLSPKPLLAALGKKYDQYLDFAQQDAHEFLRILLDAARMEELDVIKKRQPPPEKPRKRRKASLPPAAINGGPSSQPALPPIPDEEKLVSLADMVFGGKLTSILVCQKCKHVSQTYEDFNDISLSIQAEDYQHRKRDRFKKLAKKLAAFPLAPSSGSSSSGSMDVPRPSSVPPSPKERDLKQQGGLTEPPITSDPRRKSLDIVRDPLPEASAVSSREDISAAEAHDESADMIIVEKPEMSPPAKEKSKDNWAKFGKRISASIGLGKAWKDKEKEKDGDKDRSPTRQSTRSIFDSSRPPISTPSPLLPTNSSASSARKTSGSGSATLNAESSDTLPIGPTPAIILSRPSSPPLTQSPAPLSPAPTFNMSARSSTPSARMSEPQRSKSPKPPKPSAGELAYLREILADIAPPPSANSSLGNLLKPPHSHLFHSQSNGSKADSTTVPSSQNLWLSMSHYSGVEECLRMFTAVEILDGDNMVGCRRCWKIANGQVPTAEEEDEDSDNADKDPEQQDLPQPLPSRPSLRLSPPAVHIPTSMSTPTVAVFSHPDMDDRRSVSSLPVDASSAALDHSDDTDGSSEPDQQMQTVRIVPPSPASDLPLESSPPAIALANRSISAQPNGNFDTTPQPINRSVSAPLSDSADVTTPTPATQATPRLIQVAAHLPSSNSPSPMVDNTLHLPSQRHHQHEPETDESSGAESEASSIATEDSRPQPSRTGSEDSTQSVDPNSSPRKLPPSLTPANRPKKPSKPKPTIMRPAYKRYLIAVPPPVLVIHLKRFQQITKVPMISFTQFSHGFKKLDDYVSFPEHLDVTPFLAPRKEDFGLGRSRMKEMKKKREKEKCMYRLYAVIVHLGNMLGGHYIAYTALPEAPPANGEKPTQSPAPRKWAYISDTVVRLTTLEEVLKAKAYICMYERI